MARVVDELEVGVGIVDGRVAPLRVVADVQRVVRPVGDRQSGLVRRVEGRRRNLADAAAKPGRQLAVDDHGRLEEALVGGAGAGCPVEGERCPGSDQLPVDQPRDELHVVDPVRVAAVDRLVSADARGDSHRAGLGGRSLRGLRRHDHARTPVHVRKRGGEDAAARRGGHNHAAQA